MYNKEQFSSAAIAACVTISCTKLNCAIWFWLKTIKQPRTTNFRFINHFCLKYSTISYSIFLDSSAYDVIVIRHRLFLSLARRPNFALVFVVFRFNHAKIHYLHFSAQNNFSSQFLDFERRRSRIADKRNRFAPIIEWIYVCAHNSISIAAIKTKHRVKAHKRR